MCLCASSTSNECATEADPSLYIFQLPITRLWRPYMLLYYYWWSCWCWYVAMLLLVAVTVLEVVVLLLLLLLLLLEVVAVVVVAVAVAVAVGGRLMLFCRHLLEDIVGSCGAGAPHWPCCGLMAGWQRREGAWQSHSPRVSDILSMAWSRTVVLTVFRWLPVVCGAVAQARLWRVGERRLPAQASAVDSGVEALVRGGRRSLPHAGRGPEWDVGRRVWPAARPGGCA